MEKKIFFDDVEEKRENFGEKGNRSSGILLFPEGENKNENDNKEKKTKETILNTWEERSAKSGIRSMTVIGQVEGHYLLPDNQKATKYENILPAIASLEEDEDAKGLLVILNTVGGDVEAGLAIAEMIASMRKPTVSLVLGGGHSIGVPLAVSARLSFIVPSATMTVHPVRINGTLIGAPQTYTYLSRVQKRIARFVADHSRISEERYTELMLVPDELANDMGSVLDGAQAVEEGIIDKVGGLSDALEALRTMIAEEYGKP